MTRYAFPGCPWGLVRCFSVVEHLKSRLGKLASKSVDVRYVGFLIEERNPPRGKAYQCISVIYTLLSLHCLYTGCFHTSNKIFPHVGAERQTNIHTHTYTHTLFVKQFQETRCNLLFSKNDKLYKLSLANLWLRHFLTFPDVLLCYKEVIVLFRVHTHTYGLLVLLYHSHQQ